MKVSVDVKLYTARTLSNGENPLVIRLTQNNKRKYIRIGISLNPIFWDKKKDKPKPNCENKELIENIITEKLAKYQKQILEFQSTGKIYSLNQLIDAVEKPVKNISVEEYLNSIINSLIKQDRVGNASHYQALFNSLHAFTKLSQLQFVDIDLPFLNKYEASLREKGNKGNTINIKMRTLKATYNKAIKDNIVNAEYYPFNDYNVSKLKEKTPKRAISKDDMLRVVDFDVKTITKRPHSLMQFSKDLFLFSYLGCGINMVDMAHLKKEDILT
ncbi:hypothetical protein FACS1894169_09910 [Bacteroidia bacterium]|nr:hypothetical protein FACS1894169_09910 [Bacteroidia bacterium]